MSWIINWNGKDYDVDPGEFSGRELKEIKLRTQLTYSKLMDAIAREQDGEAICALFWTVDRRSNPDLKFDTYEGPPLKLVLANLDGLNTAMEELGKAMGIQDKAETQTTETTGSPSSPSSTPPTETEPFMIDLSNVTGTG